ncbi:MAG: hypothetical protein CMH56_12385 [Myxococcales bacterium]|nr:hypothetical protein [Myxococcales bacterium]|tara:strand:- start:1455 stop:2873 length:1419 start_codon:yes stop_codon:yes gene_type:complete
MVKVNGASQSTSISSAQNTAGPDPKLGDNQVLVKKGDSLWAIAKRELGDPTRWPEIADLNKHFLQREGLQPGQKLSLPKKAQADQLQQSSDAASKKLLGQVASQNPQAGNLDLKGTLADKKELENARLAANTFTPRPSGKKTWKKSTHAASLSFEKTTDRKTGDVTRKAEFKDESNKVSVSADAKLRTGGSRDVSAIGTEGTYRAKDEDDLLQKAHGTVDGLYAKGGASASAGMVFDADGPKIHADAGVSGKVAAFNATGALESKSYGYGGVSTQTAVKGEVDVLSAEASAKVEAGLNLKEGDAFVGANVGLGAYVAKASGEVRQSFGVKGIDGESHNIGSVSAGGSVSYGVGVEASVKAGMDDGKIVMKAKLGAALGVGLKGEIGLSVDVKGTYNAAKGYAVAAGEAAYDGAKYVGKKAVAAAETVGEAVYDAGAYVGDKASKAASAVSNAASSAASSVKSYAKDVWNYWF